MLDSAKSLPEPHAPSSWPWLELGRIRHLRRPRYELPVAGLDPSLVGLRILHLSDLHIHLTWMPGWDELLGWVRDDPPDLICITGDMVDCKYDHRAALPLLDRFVAGLKARLGVFAILGNHDTELLPLRAGTWNINLLCNESARIARGTGTVELVGIHSVHPLDLSRDMLTSLDSSDAKPLRVAMAHYPAHALAMANHRADLVLSGHTHGGQVCLPGGVPIITHDRLPRRFARGAHRIGDTWLVTSRGCGFSAYPIRLFCPAEAIEVVLVAQH